MFGRLLPLLAVTVLASTLTGCGTTGGDGRPTVVASFYPLQYLVESIAGDRVRVVDLTQPGVEPHDLEPQVQQVAEVASADLVVYSGGLQPAVDRTVEENAADHHLDVRDVVHLTGDNPHFWLDPLRMIKAATAIEARLAEVDPAGAGTYAANLRSLTATLTSLDHAYAAGLQHCARNLVVTSHDAFGYQTRYGLRFAPIAGLAPDTEPSPAHLNQLRDLIRTEHITTVFSEAIASPKLADTLAHDLGLSTGVLDPIEGLVKGSTQDYSSLMRTNLDALRLANGCPGSPTDGKATG